MTRRSSMEFEHTLRSASGNVSDVRVTEAVDAVCDELGIADRRGRALIARRVSEAYARGPRQPLNLVSAGLGSQGSPLL